jgi:hypothetical protein
MHLPDAARAAPALRQITKLRMGAVPVRQVGEPDHRIRHATVKYGFDAFAKSHYYTSS